MGDLGVSKYTVRQNELISIQNKYFYKCFT